MATQHFFLGARYLGARSIPDWRVVPGLEVRWNFSYALYCGRCGEIWARFLHDRAEYTQLSHHPCRKHGGGELGCHSAWFDMPTRFEEDWPPEAIRYEFDVLIEHALKEMEQS